MKRSFATTTLSPWHVGSTDPTGFKIIELIFESVVTPQFLSTSFSQHSPGLKLEEGTIKKRHGRGKGRDGGKKGRGRKGFLHWYFCLNVTQHIPQRYPQTTLAYEEHRAEKMRFNFYIQFNTMQKCVTRTISVSWQNQRRDWMIHWLIDWLTHYELIFCFALCFMILHLQRFRRKRIYSFFLYHLNKFIHCFVIFDMNQQQQQYYFYEPS